MSPVKIINVTRNTVLAESCMLAGTFYTRFKGLLGKKNLSPGTGLMIKPCNSIHMFFMRFPIDAIFISEENTIVYIIENLKPWRFSPIIRNSAAVVELSAGKVKTTGTKVGDSVRITY